MRRVPQGGDLGPVVPGARSRSPAAGRASRSPSGSTYDGRRCCCRSTRTRCARGVRRLQQLGVRVDRGDVPVLVREPRPRAAHARDHPRGVPRRRAHLAVARGDAARAPSSSGSSTTLVNAYVAPRIARYIDQPRRTSCATAGYAGQLLIMQSTGGVMPPDYVARARGHAARLGPDRRRDGRGASPPGAPASRDFVAVDMGGTQLRHLPRARRPARDQDRLELALPLLHRPADGRRAERRRRRRLDRPGAPGRAARRARSRPARRPGPSATGAAATGPTVTDADAVLGYLPADGFAGGRMTLDVDAAARRHRPRRRRAARRSTSSRRRGASSASSTPTWPTRPARCSPATAPTRATSR